MDDSGLLQIMIELAQPLAALLGGAMLLVAKVILDKLRAVKESIAEINAHISEINQRFIAIEDRFADMDRKIEEMRSEFHADIKECQRREICASHRENIMRRIDQVLAHFLIEEKKSGKKSGK